MQIQPSATTSDSQRPAGIPNMKDDIVESTADSCQQRQHDHDDDVDSATSTSYTTARRSRSLQLALATAMDFSQIGLRYRAEGNANLVLALPQFRKVLRLPKMSTDDSPTLKEQQQSTSGMMLVKQQQQKQRRIPLETPTKGSSRHNVLASIGDLTMADYVGYIDVVRRLLGSEFIFETEIIEIPSVEQRKWINETIRPFRPAQRLHKEFCGQFGLMLTDATLLPEADVLLSNLQQQHNKNKNPATPAPTPATPRTSGDIFAIEIKPKQGWMLPRGVYDLYSMKPMAEATTATHTTGTTTCSLTNATTRCRYCAVQYLKLKQRKISKRSLYCPIELFSGVPARMLTALSALLECPQNNLRIFRNGNLIYGDHSTSISWRELKEEVFKGDMLQIVQHLVVTCLLRSYEDPAITAAAAKSASSTCAAVVVDAVVGQPHSSATVEKVATMLECAKKRKLEPVAAADTASGKMTTQLKETRAQITDAELLCLPKNSVLHKVLHFQLLAKHHLEFMSRSEFSKNSIRTYSILTQLLTDGVTKALTALPPAQQYILGATALDCSLMIAFQEINANDSTHNPHLVHLSEYKKWFLTKVTILDLDPKPDSHFSKYAQQNLEAYKCLEEYLSKELKKST